MWILFREVFFPSSRCLDGLRYLIVAVPGLSTLLYRKTLNGFGSEFYQYNISLVLKTYQIKLKTFKTKNLVKSVWLCCYKGTDFMYNVDWLV